MARRIRIECTGAGCHIMARGNQGRDIYAADRTRELWPRTLGDACEKTGWRILAVRRSEFGNRTRTTSPR